ncbi:MAG: TolC family protein [bacterium]|nr:TolC family protein [bacterium]
MKKIFILLCLILWSAASWALEQPEKILTLEDSIKWAMTNNQELLAASEKRYVAEQKIEEAGSYFFPKVNLTGAYTRLSVGTPTTLPPSLGGSSLAVGVSNHYAARISVNQYLFTGGYLVNQLNIAQKDLDITIKTYETVRRKVYLEVTRRFYDVLYQQQVLEFNRESLSQVKTYIEAAKNRTKAKDYENTLLEIERSRLEMQIAGEEEKLQLVYTAFNKAVGFELDSQVKLVGDFKTLTPEEDTQGLNTYIALALDRSPVLQGLSLEEKKINHMISQAFSERYPTIVLGADYERSGLNSELEGRNWTATLALHYPLFNGWLSWARVRQMRSELKSTNLLRVRTSDDLKMNIEESYRRYMRAGKNLTEMSKNRDLAQKALDSAMDYYKDNQLSCTDLLAVQKKTIETKIQALDNAYEYTVGEQELKVATGLDLVDK